VVERKNKSMKLKNSILILWAILIVGPVASAFADHGALATRDRDAWIDPQVDALAASGWVSPLDRPARELTNLQVAQLTAQAAQKLTDPENASTPAPKGLKELVAEFKDELSAMRVDLAKVEDRLAEAKERNRKFKAITKDALQKTGTQFTGSSRMYFANYRSFGNEKLFGDSDWNNIAFVDIGMKSVPVPCVLFNADFRVTRTFGAYYVDPLPAATKLAIRWLALTCAGKPGSFTAGDFWKSYTPLTLWNSDIPVYTLLEPTTFNRFRKGLEEWVYMDHGNDWRMRGLDASTEQSWDGSYPLKSFKAQAMGGILQTPSTTQYAQEYGGTQERLGFFDDQLNLRATGLLVQHDPSTSSMTYSQAATESWARRQMVGSLSADGAVTVADDWKLAASGEYAKSRYQDNLQVSSSVLHDRAVLSNGAVQWKDLRVGVKYLNIGPDFYSLGAQTNRYTPVTNCTGYLTSNQNLEDGLPGYRNDFVLQSLGRPAFAPYDRLSENILPYGDATPNRHGFVLNGSDKLGKDGWIKPQVSLSLGMKEIQPDYVLTGLGYSELPVDSQTTTATARTFQNVEGALTLDLSKVVSKLPSTCSVGLDFKHQTTDLGVGDDSLKVDTFIVSADAGPFKHVPLIGALILSAAFEETRSRGNEYVLTPGGVNPGLACYSSVYDTTSLGTYQYQALNIDRTTIAFGFKFPVTPTFRIYGDWLSRKYVWKDQSGFDRREQIWKLTHELTF
jgi:hypothetical protein